MNTAYNLPPEQNQTLQKPDIGSVIGARIDLRRAGREQSALCPFHSERTPSFFVSDAKQVFFCRGCHEGGDVIDFIMRLDGLSFPDACRSLGIDTGSRPQPPIITPNRQRAARLAIAWALAQRAKLNTMIAEALERRDLADEVGDSELAERFDREWFLLSEIYDSLEYPRGIAELLAVREGIESITATAEASL